MKTDMIHTIQRTTNESPKRISSIIISELILITESIIIFQITKKKQPKHKAKMETYMINTIQHKTNESPQKLCSIIISELILITEHQHFSNNK